MAEFRWENIEQFISLVNLLSMRNGGQVGHVDEEETNDVDSTHGDDGGSCNSTGREDGLKELFLDKLAEVMSRDKGGKYVACATLRESVTRGIDKDTKISCLVARNEAFRDVDRAFCSKLETLLTAINVSVYVNVEARPALEETLWEELLRYDAPRLECYIHNFQENLKAFKAEGSLDNIPPYRPTQPSRDDDGARTFNDFPNIGPYSKTTHIAYMEHVQAQIRELDSILSSGDGKHRLLAEKAYSIRHMLSLETFISSCPKASVGRRLLSDIMFLGRIRSCFTVLVDAATTIAGFSHFTIVLVENLPPRTCPSDLPPLANALKFLGLSLNPTTVQKFVNAKASVISAERSFKDLQRSIARKVLPSHAELQIILHLAQTMSLESIRQEVYPYIGCSKLTCFLCTAFLKSYELAGVVFRTRGSHGKIYTLWSIPDMSGLQEDMDVVLHSALKKMRNVLVRELIQPITSINHVAESSAGVTDVYSPQSVSLRNYHRELAAQREFDTLRASTWGKNFSGRNHTSIEEEKIPSPQEVVGPVRSMDTPDECSNCEMMTTRRCSRCGGPLLCSQACEDKYDSYHHNFKCAIGRPLDSADYLHRACWRDEMPDDDDALKDFGFDKFPSAHDRVHLFGLYIGLTRMGVSSRDLHRWQVEGTLVENIQSKYEAIPERHRGGYYPWFKKNLRVFNGDETLDMVAVARPHLDPCDRSKQLHELTPEAKHISFVLYTFLLNGYHPSPTFSDEFIQDLYINFGFCAGRGNGGEQAVSFLYGELIARCSFEEFWKAYESGSLVSLMDAKGLERQRKSVMHLDVVLKIKPGQWCHTVWHLKRFTHSSDVDPPRFVTVDYGFFNCETVEEKFALKETYGKLLSSFQVDPMLLHAACVSGKIFDFARRHLPTLEPRFKRLMHNPYPLPIDVEYAGMCTRNVVIHGPPELAKMAMSMLGPKSVRIMTKK